MNVKVFLLDVVYNYYQKKAPWIKHTLTDQINLTTETELLNKWFSARMPERLSALTREKKWDYWITLLCLDFWDRYIGEIPDYPTPDKDAPKEMKND